MKPTATMRTLSRRAGAVAIAGARLVGAAIGRRGAGPVLVLVLIAALGTQGYLAFEPKLADSGEPAGEPVSAAELQALQTAALSCPSLTAPRLAGQVMATTGFDAEAVGANGARGLAGLGEVKWDHWQPWPDAQQSDPEANIVALAHETCEMVGELRAAGVPGDPWRTAVAATRSGVDAVVKVQGVPADAQKYVDTVSAYADWYAQQPEFGGADSGTPSPSTDAQVATGAKPLPAEYVDDVVRAGRICTTITPARVAAQLMANSAFDPNKRSDNGAEGIAQFLPSVWAAYTASPSEDWSPPYDSRTSEQPSPFDPDEAILMLGTVMCDLSGQLSALTSGDPYTLALAAFQWGATAIRQAGGVPQSSTLQNNADQVLSYVSYYEKDPRLDPDAKKSKSPSPSASASTSPTPSGAPTPGHDTHGPSTDGRYQIENGFNGTVLDLPGDDNAAAVGVVVQQWHNQRAKDQFWRLVRVGNTPYYRIINSFSGKALAVQDGSKQDGAHVIQVKPEAGKVSQQWRFDDAGGGAYWIVNRNSGSVLDVLGDDTNSDNGGTIDQWHRQDKAKDQRWLLTR